MNPAQTNSLRLRAQLLHPDTRLPTSDPEGVVGHLVGVQAQEADSAAIALGIRAPTLTARQIETSRLQDRTFVRTWAFRGTLHLVAAVDLHPLLALLGPVFIDKSRRRFRQLNLTDDRYAAALDVIRDGLSEGPMTRAALDAYLRTRGTSLEGQALYHTLRRAGLEAVICYGPDLEGEHSYVLLDSWLPDRPSISAPSLADLARRYLTGHGPARPEDFASWTGLGLRDSRDAFRQLGDELIELQSVDEPAWLHRDQGSWREQPTADVATVRLLPAYDPYLLAYRTRDLIVAARHADRIHPGGGFLRPTVIAGGTAVATWHPKLQDAQLTVTVKPFADLSDPLRDALAVEVAALGAFYDADATLTLS